MRRLATALSALGFLWALTATVYVLAGAGREGISTRFDLVAGAADAGAGGLPLTSSDGVWVLALLAAVTLLAGLPVGVALFYPEGQRTTTWGAGLLLLSFSAVTALTVGLFYAPCAVVVLVAAIVTGAPGGEIASGSGGGATSWDRGSTPRG